MSTLQTRKTTYSYMEYLRVISIFAVIVIHVSGANWFRIDIGSANWIVQTIFNVAGRFSVCVFCMISGALLLRPDKDIRVQDIFSHYIRRILICFVVWVVLYALFYTILNHEDIAYFITRLFRLPDHLWYLLMLMGMYLALPVLRMITKNRSVTRYMIWLIIAFCIVTLISGTTGFFDEMAGENYVYSLWKGFLGNIDELKVAFIPGYLGLFLLGHYIHEYGLGTWHKRIVCAAIPSLILSGLLTVWISILTGRYVYTFMLETNPLVILASAGIFAFFRGQGDTMPSEKTPGPMTKQMVWLGSNAFGIYLIHFAIRDLLAQCFGFDVASYPAILSIPLNSLLIFVISLVLIVVIRKVPFLKALVS